MVEEDRRLEGWFFRFPSPEREWPVSIIKESGLRRARWAGQGVRGCRVQCGAVWGTESRQAGTVHAERQKTEKKTKYEKIVKTAKGNLPP